MKKFFKYILVAVAALCLGAFDASAYSYGGCTVPGEGRYLTWGDGRGCLLGNSYTNHASNEFTLYVKKDTNGVLRFYCDQDCTIQAIGIGYVYTWDTNVTAPLHWVSIGENGGDQVSVTSINEFVKRFNSQLGTVESAIRAQYAVSHAQNQNSIWDVVVANDLSHRTIFHFVLHNTCTFTSTSSEGYNVSDFIYGSGDKRVYSFDFSHGVGHTVKEVTIKRADDFVGDDADNAMISVEPTYAGGEDAATTRYVNASFGNSGVIVTVDNNTSNDEDVAVKVGHNGLFMMSNVTITNSQADINNPSTYHGIGVKLLSGGEWNYHNAAVELGNDQQGDGTCRIEGQSLGIDAYAGVVRLKRTNGNMLGKNTVAVSIDKGVMLGKWAKDISSFTGNDVLITLKNPDKWYSGEIVFASGRTKKKENDLVESQYVPAEWVCPLSQSELTHLTYAPETDLTKTYSIIYDTTGVPENVDYEFPVFRLGISSIYNTRTQLWYPTLYAAVNDSGTNTTNGENKALADGDVLVYYGNVNEPQGVTISKNITIRSAKSGYQPDIDADPTRTIDTDGYISSYSGNESSFITVAEGKTVTFGDYVNGSSETVVSGNYTIDMNQKGRAIDAIGTVNANAHFTIQNGKITTGSNPNGGAIRIRTSGTLNLTDACFEGNTTSGYGNAIYQEGTMNVSGSPTFGSSDYVYLPEGKVITKVGAFNPTATVPVKLQNEVNGRDILVSNPGVQSTDPGVVSSEDQGKLNVVLATVNRFSVAYNASGLNGGGSPANVIELQEGHGDILIKKTGMKAFDSVEFTVCLAGSTTPVYTVVLSGIDDSGSEVSVTIKELPVGSYTVTETGWSWTYNCSSPSATHDVIPDTCTEFAFVNTEDTTKPDHAESNKNNVFNAGDGIITGGLNSYNGSAL